MKMNIIHYKKWQEMLIKQKDFYRFNWKTYSKKNENEIKFTSTSTNAIYITHIQYVI